MNVTDQTCVCVCVCMCVGGGVCSSSKRKAAVEPILSSFRDALLVVRRGAAAPGHSFPSCNWKREAASLLCLIGMQAVQCV